MGCLSSHTMERKLSLTKSDFVHKKHGSVRTYYETLDTLGDGGYGVVTRIRERKSGLVRAMKEVQKSKISDNQHQSILNEIEILTRLDHPNIMKIYEVLESPKSYQIICEYLSGGELLDVLLRQKKFPEEKTAKYIYDILSGVYYCHNMNIVHNDLKLENLMLDSKDPDARVKIIDFGISQYLNKSGLTGQLGSVYYLAPEILTGNYNEKVDLWSIGVIMYYMLTGNLPFRCNTNEDLLEKSKTGKFDTSSRTWLILSSECKDLIIKFLNPNPKLRISASEAMQHIWFDKALQLSSDSINTNFYTSIKKFQKLNPIATAILVYISTQMLTSQEETPMVSLFKSIDTDGNGKLSKLEIYEACKKFPLLSSEEIDEIFNTCDMDQSGFIDYSEFLAVSMTWNHILKREKIKMIFDFFDMGRDGTLTIPELRTSLIQFTDIEWVDFLKIIDTNQDGVISLEEFRNYLCRLVDE